MPRESAYHAVVIKKQAYGDADEIITFFTLESGRVRGLAKSIKLPQSKLQNSLQGLFYVRVVLARGSDAGRLKKIIRCEVLDAFMPLRASLPATKAGLFAAEAVYKATADDQKNPRLFDLLLGFLRGLGRAPDNRLSYYEQLAGFQIGLLEALGFAVQPPGADSAASYFSCIRGGFCDFSNEPDRLEAGFGVTSLFLRLSGRTPSAAQNSTAEDAERLASLLGDFLEYHLERRLHARRIIE